MKGLRETIADMEGAEMKENGDDEEEEEEEEWVDEVVGEGEEGEEGEKGGEGGEGEEGEEGGEGRAEGGAELLLAKFDDIEAEIESVLELVQSEEEEEERKDDDKEKETMERGVERMGGAAHRESVTFPRTRISLPQESVEVVKREQLSPSSWRVVEERASPPPPLRKEHRYIIQMSLLGPACCAVPPYYVGVAGRFGKQCAPRGHHPRETNRKESKRPEAVLTASQRS